MRIIITTLVNSDYQKVFSGFTLDLFSRLAPPLLSQEITRYDGCKVNDRVELKLLFPGFSQEWVSLITRENSDTEEINFTDEGIKLPFFLKSWRHRHRILNRGRKAEIIDDITFTTPYGVLDLLVYPFMYMMFYYRKRVYREYFNR